MKSLDAAQARAQYEADGYYIHTQPLIPSDVIGHGVAGMDEVRAGRYDTGTPPCPSMTQPGDDPRKLCKIEMPQIANRAIMDVLRYPALGELAAAITGASMVQVWWVQLLIKPPVDPDGTIATNIGLHQDRQYWQAWEEGSELFTAWIAMSDVTADTGPMKFWRGSHKWGFLNKGDFHGQDLDAQRHEISGPDGKRCEEAAAILPPGGVSFHDRLTFHGSGPNLSSGPRRSFAVHMRTEKSRPVNNARQGLTEFIDNEAWCPVIYGKLG
ncbi:MAG: phytanoyl-CoA dioxygenase family protein [Candidatus Hydrogenedentes bacterium]|nr:phytanoyl-CoA dioxygenase family protein [Candidatus Hydrogenedentota bacterium]